MSKPYSYFSEKVYILNSRNLKTNNNYSERLILSNYNYYNLINAYKEPFLKLRTSTTNDEFKNHVSLSNLESLAKFDIDMRVLLLSHILKIEEKIKHHLVDSFYIINNSLSDCLQVESEYLDKKYYSLNNVYSKNNFNRSNSQFQCTYSYSKTNQKYVIDRNSIYYDFVSKSYAQINKQHKNNQNNKNNSIKAYVEKHNIVPLWVLINNLTLGNISYFYLIQKEDVQKLFLKKIGLYRLKNISDLDLIFNASNILKILTLCRNLCAHNERLYNYKVSIPLSDDFFYFSECLPFHQNIVNGTIFEKQSKKRKDIRSSIYVFIYSIYIFLDPIERSKFISDINNNLNKLKENINPYDFSIILSMMGLNFDWFNSLKNIN